MLRSPSVCAATAHRPRAAFCLPTRALFLAVSGWILISGLPALNAQVLPLGGEFQVNASTTGYQVEPQVANLPAGGFVVAWTDAGPSYDPVINGRRFDTAGAPVGGEFEVGPFESRYASGIGTDADGHFVVVWGTGFSGPGGGDPDDIHARRFDSDTTPLGGPFTVNSSPGGEYAGHGRVAVHADGQFVVVWDHDGAFGRRFDSTGSPLGAEFEIAPGLSRPDVAPRPAGGFVVAGTVTSYSTGSSVSTGGCTLQVQAQRFAASGAPVGTPIPVAELQECGSGVSVAVSASGTFVVTWTESGSFPDFNLKARRFAPSGTPLSDAFRVDSTATGVVFAQEVRFRLGGEFVVVWMSQHSLGDDPEWSIQARHFAPEGTPLGDQFQVNSLTAGTQGWPSAAFDLAGTLAVAWDGESSTGGDTSETSIQVRRFLLPFFTDGFENGDTSRWSATQAASRSVSD